MAGTTEPGGVARRCWPTLSPGPSAQAGWPGTRWPGTSPPAWPTPTCPKRRSGWPPRCARGAGARPRTVVNDTFAVLRAGLDGTAAPGAPHWGVAVTCGAGINCVGVAPGRAHDRVPRARRRSAATGAAGHGLGRAALWWAVRAEDGRGPADRAARRRGRALRGADGAATSRSAFTSARSPRTRCSGSPRSAGRRGATGDEVAGRPGAAAGRGDLRDGAGRHAPPGPDRARDPRGARRRAC